MSFQRLLPKPDCEIHEYRIRVDENLRNKLGDQKLIVAIRKFD